MNCLLKANVANNVYKKALVKLDTKRNMTTKTVLFQW